MRWQYLQKSCWFQTYPRAREQAHHEYGPKRFCDASDIHNHNSDAGYNTSTGNLQSCLSVSFVALTSSVQSVEVDRSSIFNFVEIFKFDQVEDLAETKGIRRKLSAHGPIDIAPPVQFSSTSDVNDAQQALLTRSRCKQHQRPALKMKKV